MTISVPLFSGQYYRLPPAGSVQGRDAATAAAYAGDFAGILDAVSSQGSATDSGIENAFSLTLSPAALQALESFAAAQQGSDIFGSPTGVLLSREQQEEITAILTRYKDAPFTQETYERIQGDLKAAGLSPDQLILTQTLNDYDPSGVLLSALGDNESSLPSTASFVTDGANQAAAANYMQQIVNEWRGISSTADA